MTVTIRPATTPTAITYTAHCDACGLTGDAPVKRWLERWAADHVCDVHDIRAMRVQRAGRS